LHSCLFLSCDIHTLVFLTGVFFLLMDAF
jgi:hypothetical protein